MAKRVTELQRMELLQEKADLSEFSEYRHNEEQKIVMIPHKS